MLGPEIAEKFTLDERVAVITGAASGLGRESARVLALAGAKVVLSDIDNVGLEKTEALIRDAGGVAAVQPANVAVRDEVETLADTAASQLGGLDIWINSAGLPLVEPVLSTSPDAAHRVIDVNMMGTYWGCAAAGRVMKDLGGGSIVNISSGGGDSPVPNLSIYGMTKAAVNQLTRVCAHEFGSFGIRVNAIAPGWIETRMGSSLFRDAAGNIDPELRDRVRREQAAANPLGINGSTMDIALALLYFSSDASRFVSGQVLRVNGGA